MRKQKVVLYARISTRDKEQDTENQLTQLRSWCAHHECTVVHEYIDQDSGTNSSRPEFLRLMVDARRGLFDLVFFWSLDQFSREGVRPTLRYLQQLEEDGVAFRSYTEQYIDSAGMFKDAIISILATLAKQESVQQSERVKAGLERARSKGKRLGRPALSPREIATIMELRQRMSVRDVAKELKISRSVVSKYSPHAHRAPK